MRLQSLPYHSLTFFLTLPSPLFFHQVTVNTLRDLLSAGGVTPSSLDFVFVSACHSRSVGQAFVDAGARHVVCVGVEAMIQVNLTPYPYHPTLPYPTPMSYISILYYHRYDVIHYVASSSLSPY